MEFKNIKRNQSLGRVVYLQTQKFPGNSDTAYLTPKVFHYKFGGGVHTPSHHKGCR